MDRLSILLCNYNAVTQRIYNTKGRRLVDFVSANTTDAK